MRRDGAAVLLVAVGVLGLRLGLTDGMLDYVKPWMRWPVVGASVALVGLGLWELLDVLRRGDEGADGDHGDDHGHRHAHGRGPMVAWLLLIPVVVSLVIAPGALQADAVRRALPGSLIPLDALPPLPQPVDGRYVLSLAEFASRSVGPEGAMSDLGVRLTGFVVRRGDEASIARFRLNCCAADAQVAEVVLSGLGQLPEENTWWVVEGRWVPAQPGAGHRPRLAVEQMVPIPQPTNPYE